MIVVVRQAGSAAGLMPAVEELIDEMPSCRVAVIAFSQAVPTCREVVRDLGRFSLHAVETEEEARELFELEIQNAAFVLTGTSSQAEADAFYWRTARAHRVSSVAYLDQSSNIEMRFPGHRRSDWPDTLAVIDDRDRKLVATIAPAGVAVREIGSPAIERITRSVQELRDKGVRSDPARIVFATEPVEDFKLYRAINGFMDEDSFDLALGMIRRHHPQAKLALRLHPRDSRERWLAKLPADVSVEWDTDTRAACLARAGRVFGMRSFFLLEALACGVTVVSIQPDRKTPSPLTDGKMPIVTRVDEYTP